MRSHSILSLLLLSAACTPQPHVDGLRPLRAPPFVAVHDRVETYAVQGNDRATIGAALRVGISDSTGGHSASYHWWLLTWTFTTRSQPLVCTVAQATVRLFSVVTLPEWVPPPDADSALRTEWVRYRRALAVHESGHREIVHAGAARIQRAIQEARARDYTDHPVHRCLRLYAVVPAAAGQLLTALRAEDAEYDRQTDHGATQGAVWAAGVIVRPN